MKDPEGPHLPENEQLGDDFEHEIQDAITKERRAKRVADLFLIILFLALIMALTLR